MKFKNCKLYMKMLIILAFIIMSPLLLSGFLIVGVLLLSGFLFVGALFIIISPFEYPKYKRSNYYKNYKKKYSLFITKSPQYIIIEYLKKKNIRYSFDFESEELTVGENIYLFPWFQAIEYHEDKWIIDEEEYISDTSSPLLDDSKIKGRNNVKIIISKNVFYKNELKIAQKDKIFVIYDDKDIKFDHIFK